MRYKAKIVGDDELPASVDRVIVQHDSDDPLILIKKSAAPPAFRWHEENATTPTRRARVWRVVARLSRRTAGGVLRGLVRYIRDRQH